MRSLQITAREAGGRLDRYLFRVLADAPAGFVYKMLRKKNIVLNEAKATGSEILAEGDEVRLYLAEDTFLKFAPAFAQRKDPRGDAAAAGGPAAAPLTIVYEDADILVIDKPAGLLSQKAKPGDDSANDRVIAYLLESGQLTREDLRTFHPSVCNRLDRNTSGLLIAGKTMRGLQETAALLRGRDLRKYYHALVLGQVAGPAALAGYLSKDEKTNRVRITPAACPDDAAVFSRGEGVDREEGAWIETEYRPLAYFGDATLLEVHLITGRSHQIRAHLASIGHPVLGDEKYGDAGTNRALSSATGIKRQLLCACRMEFPDGRVIAISDPESFRTAQEWLSDRGGATDKTPVGGRDGE